MCVCACVRVCVCVHVRMHVCGADLHVTVAAVLESDHYRHLAVGPGGEVVCDRGWVIQVVLDQVIWGGEGGGERVPERGRQLYMYMCVLHI